MAGLITGHLTPTLGSNMKSKSILIILALCFACFSLDVSKVVKLPKKLKSGKVIAWPINCEGIGNCHEINRELHEIYENQFNIKIISPDTVKSFFGNDVPSYTDVDKLNEFRIKYNFKFIIAPLIIDISIVGTNGGVEGEIREFFLLPDPHKKTMVHLKESLKIINAEDGEIIARVYGEDDSRTNDKIDEILEVTEDLVKEIKE
jgi:hypothetical protein